MTAIRRLGIALLPAVAALLLASCGTGPASPAPAGGAAGGEATAPVDPGHNAADVMFLQMMIAHNEQGLELTSLAVERAASEEVRELAGAIDTTQRDEVSIMESWLASWNEPTTPDPDTADHAAHADHGGLPATGPDEIAALREASDVDFETTFLLLLTGHQNSAMELTGLAGDGVNPQVSDLADRIEQSRGDQVAYLLRLISGEAAAT